MLTQTRRHAYLASLILSGTSAEAVENGAAAAAATFRQLKKELRSRVEVLGPVVAPLGKIRGRYRRQILLKSEGRPELHRILTRFRERAALSSVVRLAIDVDPVDML